MATSDEAPPTESAWDMYTELLDSMHHRLQDLPDDQSWDAYRRSERVGTWVDELYRRHGATPTPGQWIRLLAIIDADLADDTAAEGASRDDLEAALLDRSAALMALAQSMDQQPWGRTRGRTKSCRQHLRRQ